MARPSRYELITKLASGGMATVYVGVTRGPLGFSRIVAVKRAHPHLLEDPEFANMFRDEARLASRLRHPHVVAVLDVEHVEPDPRSNDGGELYLVMDYVEGASLSQIMKRAWDKSMMIPAPVAVRIVIDTCAGLDAAHRLTDDIGARLGIVHRDVSPHNLLVGVDGMTRVTDFGIARATTSPSFTRTGLVKGKLEYLAPEYLARRGLDARSDIYSLGIVFWEALANRRLFKSDSELETMQLVAEAKIPPLALYAPEIAGVLGPVLDRALAAQPSRRFDTAAAFGAVLEDRARTARLVASHDEVGVFVETLMRDSLEKRRKTVRDKVREIEDRGNLLESTADLPPEPATVPAPLRLGAATGGQLAAAATTLPMPDATGPIPVAAASGSDFAPLASTLILDDSHRPTLGSGSANAANGHAAIGHAAIGHAADADVVPDDPSDTARVLIPSTQPPIDVATRRRGPALVVGGVVVLAATIFGIGLLRAGDDAKRPAANVPVASSTPPTSSTPSATSTAAPAPLETKPTSTPSASATAAAAAPTSAPRSTQPRPGGVDLHAIPPSPYAKKRPP